MFVPAPPKWPKESTEVSPFPKERGLVDEILGMGSKD
jgi:hypothetical protein